MKNDAYWIGKAIRLATQNIIKGGGPFACIIVKDGEILARGVNKVVSMHDPTAHAEIQAIRNACKNLKSHQLDECVIYASCEPCPMCFGAIYWARPKRVVFAATKEQAAVAGFDDAMIYKAIADGKGNIPLNHLVLPNANDPFDKWIIKHDKDVY